MSLGPFQIQDTDINSGADLLRNFTSGPKCGSSENNNRTSTHSPNLPDRSLCQFWKASKTELNMHDLCVFVAVILLRDVMLRSLADSYQSFRGTCCFHLQGRTAYRLQVPLKAPHYVTLLTLKPLHLAVKAILTSHM
jgi:hypothetical protein